MWMRSNMWQGSCGAEEEVGQFVLCCMSINMEE